MKTSTRIIAAVAAAGAVAVAGLALAQPGYGPGFGMGPGAGPGWGHMGGWGGMGGGMMGWGGMGRGGPGWGGMGGPGWSGGMGPGMMGFGGFDMSQAAAGRLAAFKAQLKITPAQETAWKSYESAVTEQAKAMQAMRDQFHAQWQNVKPGEAGPDMAAQHQAMFALRQSGWQAQQKALKDLQAVLTPEQVAAMNGGWGPRGLPRR